MSKRKSAIKPSEQTHNRGKVSAKINDLYSVELGNPPSLFWFLDFEYQQPRSVVVYHDWESIKKDTLPTADQWADRIVARFDCIGRESIVCELSNWLKRKQLVE
jgi:hypothetical protein